MEAVPVVIAFVVYLAWQVIKTYNENTRREKRSDAESEISRSIERQFERPPNEHDLL